MEQYVTGAAIKALREKKGLTQRDLAEQIGVSDKTISKWETGKGLPDITLLEPLSAALGISVTELLAGDRKIVLFFSSFVIISFIFDKKLSKKMHFYIKYSLHFLKVVL